MGFELEMTGTSPHPLAKTAAEAMVSSLLQNWLLADQRLRLAQQDYLRLREACASNDPRLLAAKLAVAQARHWHHQCNAQVADLELETPEY